MNDADPSHVPSAARKRLLRELQDLEPFAYDKCGTMMRACNAALCWLHPSCRGVASPLAHHRRKTIAPPNASKFYATGGRRRRAPPDAYAAYVLDDLSPSSLGTAVEVRCVVWWRSLARAASQADSDDDMPLAQLLQVPARTPRVQRGDVGMDSQGTLADRCASSGFPQLCHDIILTQSMFTRVTCIL